MHSLDHWLRRGVAACLLTWLALRPAPAAGSWDMSADTLELSQQDERAHAEGDVRVDYHDITMTADEVDADFDARTMTAQGNVCFSQDGRLLSGEQLHYDLGASRGWLTQARARWGPLIFTGDRIEVWPRKVSIKSGSFTTCDRPVPDYRITARDITVVNGRRVILRGAQLWYRKRRLLRLPRITQPVPGTNVDVQGLVPRSGYAAGDGLFVGLRYLWTVAGDTDASVEFRSTMMRGLRGIGRAERQQRWGTLSLDASSKADIGRERISGDDPRTGIRTILVDRLPELSALTARTPLTPWLAGRAFLSAGRYYERESRVQASRFAATFFADAPDIPVSRSASLSPGLAFRALSSGPDSQTVSVYRLSLGLWQTRPSNLAFSYIRRTPHGRSPFLFDEVEIERELASDARVQLGRLWRTEAASRYDLDRHSFRDVTLTLARRAHCLEYSLSWLKTRGEVRAQVGLAGF